MNFESIEKAPNDVVSTRRLSPTKDNSHPVERTILAIIKMWIKLEHHQTTSIYALVCNTIDRYHMLIMLIHSRNKRRSQAIIKLREFYV